MFSMIFLMLSLLHRKDSSLRMFINWFPGLTWHICTDSTYKPTFFSGKVTLLIATTEENTIFRLQLAEQDIANHLFKGLYTKEDSFLK